ncbi:GNAT family N-acetyltransferase [Paenalcaligenes niemegkensis]|uniref:GNAT family N-acetyltransferase n=1 Tax=Paenalcaligenes niemegkensis TaxID=2895469 RepID=UPI001EE7A644|nr:GNAT family N-acetyltransferase [Paenalcaligenes niemegkensis]MCQ9617491.1 GNAT family N-acetyltransferase [Paenalcaligenes niemegkensis]
MSDSLHDYVLREATPEDVPQIHRLMLEMAAFENLMDQFQATENSLHDNLFSIPPAVNCSVIVHQDNPQQLVSYLMWFHNYSSFLAKRGLYLEDIYIVPAHRRKGLGKYALQHLAAKAIELGCGRFEWVVLDWNQNAIDFYEQQGASVLPEWRVVRIAGEALVRLANTNNTNT